MTYDIACEELRRVAMKQVEKLTGKSVKLVYGRQLLNSRRQFAVTFSVYGNGTGLTVDWFGGAHCFSCAEAKAYNEYFESINEKGGLTGGYKHQGIETNGANRIGNHFA